MQTLSHQSLETIDHYLHFRLGSAVSSVPYFNNKTARVRRALSVFVGKGSPHEITDEAEALVFKNHINGSALADESLKKLLVDNHIGIDCSGFAYHVLDAESFAAKKIRLNRKLHFIHSHGLVGMFVSRLHPAQNVDVATLADDKNSRLVSLDETKPGDMITMISNSEDDERNHILVIHGVDYGDGGRPIKIHYSHAVAYPEDGIYGSGIRQGTISLAPADRTLMTALWTENGSAAGAERIFARAEKSKTELRRLRWF